MGNLTIAPQIKVLHSNSHNTLTDQFAKWIYEASKNGQVISKHQIAREISKLKSGGDVTEAHVTSWIAKARFYCEKHLGCTLSNVHSQGWRASTKRETAIYYCKSVKKTIAWADRTLRLQVIADKQEIPNAIREVFYKAEGSIQKLSKTKQRYFQIWQGILNQQREKQELLEHENNN